MKNLLVEIGNTALKAAESEGTTLGKIFRYQGERPLEYMQSIIRKVRPETLTVASAAEISEEEEVFLKKECRNVMVLDRNHKEILLQRGLPEYLSYDRAAGIIAASFLFKDRAVVIFDFGTTFTVDFAGADGKYLGGNVSPGCRTRFKALNRYSKNLPLVDMPGDVPPAGTSIVSSVESGVISGMMFEMEGYMRRNPDGIFVFTGGDASYFAKRTVDSVFVVSNLSLMGLAIITDGYDKKTLQ